MLFSLDSKRTTSATSVDRPLPPLPPSASSPRSASERSQTPSLLSRSNSVSSEDTLWTVSSSNSGSPQLKKRLWERSNSFRFRRKNSTRSRRSSLADDATVVSFEDLESLCRKSSIEKSDSEESSEYLSKEDSRNFEDLNRTVERYGMPHHPYNRDDVSYMQSYSPNALNSDYHTFELLRRLNPNADSPTFHDYGRQPPLNVLDLGCGEGHWVLSAAQAWRYAGTHVTGLDIIDLHSNIRGRVYCDRPPNVTFVRGNFTKYNLPFPDDTFDLVRMANLGLAIRCWRWDIVLHEVRRVLCPGGRLELIDDQLLFPRIPSLTELRGYKGDSPVDPKFPPQISDTRSSSHQRSSSLGDRPQSVWERDYKASEESAKKLESALKKMLLNRGYAPDAPMHQKLTQSLVDVFGADHDHVMSHHFSLGVPSREDAAGQESAKRPASRPRYSEGDLPRPLGSPMSGTFESTPKALRVLVGDCGVAKVPPPYQPLGLLMLDSSRRLLPFSPAELEMHACKNMHVLLSCKKALTEHMLELKDHQGMPVYTAEDIEDLLFEYDRFKRMRFNWPLDYPGLRLDEELGETPRTPPLRLGSGTPPMQARDRAWSNPNPLRKPTVGTDRTIEVRAIRVLHAVKH